MVGAPQYFEKDGDIGGAIYVYVNKAGKWNKVTPARIDGPRDSMFGLAVENLGDINQDGYDGKDACTQDCWSFVASTETHNHSVVVFSCQILQ